jgi:L-Ala-D/L-Glu epimerase
MQITCSYQSWPIAGTFTIARGSKTTADVIYIQLTRDGHTGHGEGVPYSRYGESVAGALEALQAEHKKIIALKNRRDVASLDLPYAAKNALDCALWDLECKEKNQTPFETPPHAVTTAYTLSLDTPEAMASAAKAAIGRSLLKLKLGREGDEARLAAIRAAVPQARLIVDANEGWGADVLPTMLAACAQYGVELVEQPLPADNDDALLHMQRQTIICADESAHGVASLAKLKDKYDAVNIKLDKTGGLTPALEMAEAARADGFKIMVGCMLATSLAMAPAFVVAQAADYVDLDGPLLLAKDRANSIQYNGSLMQPPPRALWG